MNKPIRPIHIALIYSIKHQWRRIRRYELTRTLRATEKRLDYVKRSLDYIDRAEGRNENRK